MKITNVQEMVKIDKSNKWFQTKKKIISNGITSTYSIYHTSDINHAKDGSTSDPKNDLNIKNASLTYKS